MGLLGFVVVRGRERGRIEGTMIRRIGINALLISALTGSLIGPQVRMISAATTTKVSSVSEKKWLMFDEI